MKTTIRSRALLTCFVLATGFTLFSFRLVHVQVLQANEYSREAAQNHTKKQPIYARRGVIQDVHGESLAQNEPVKTIIADASLIKDPAGLAQALEKPLAMTVEKLREKFAQTAEDKATGKVEPRRYIIVKKGVAETTATEIAQIVAGCKVNGIVASPDAIYGEQDFVRIYPNAQMLSHVIGYANGENIGVEGVERTMERHLHGTDGFRYIERDRIGREIVPYRGQERAARDGSNVKLTIDMGLQNIVESELDAAVKQYRPKSATIILMRPQTGEILAMATRPNFDPNKQEDLAKEAVDRRRNRAITDVVEPGSTFKIVPTAAALSEKVVDRDTMIFCENGHYDWCRLRDHKPYADLSVSDILVKSSNIGVAKLGMQLGEQKFYEYVRKFGFGERTGVMLPGEVAGLLETPRRWSKISITRIPMGQEIAATPLQIVTAMGAIANGGSLMVPQIVQQIVDSEGKTISEFPPQEVRRVASKQACDSVRDALVQVVSKRGTAERAAVRGFYVAGKTGTAQKRDEKGKMSHEKYVVSFVGFLPAEDPAIVGLVLLDEAKTKQGDNYGGKVAAPVFASIGERAARYLSLKPTRIELPDKKNGTGDLSGMPD